MELIIVYFKKDIKCGSAEGNHACMKWMMRRAEEDLQTTGANNIVKIRALSMYVPVSNDPGQFNNS